MLLSLIYEYLVLEGKTGQMDELALRELNKLLSKILITVRKKEDNKECDPIFLRAFFASF